MSSDVGFSAMLTSDRSSSCMSGLGMSAVSESGLVGGSVVVFGYPVGASLPQESGLVGGLSGDIWAPFWCFPTARNWLQGVPPRGALPKHYLWILVILVNICQFPKKGPDV